MVPTSRLLILAATLGAIAAAMLASAAATARAASGGPDGYGYTWRDGFEPGVVYAWEDITATGTEITIVADDANTRLRPISFSFPYRGLQFDRLAACTNGWASLVDGGADSYENGALPTAGPPLGTLAAFWDDFKMDDGGKMFFQDFGDRVVVSWIDVPYFADVTKHATFQIILRADGTIRCQLAGSDGPLDSATIGIESTDDTDGLTAWFNVPIPPAPYVVEFTPPAPIDPVLDCASAAPLPCGTDLTEDLATGVAAQSEYRCTRDVLDGRERVYLLDFATPTTARLRFEPISGNPRLIVLPACDPNACSIPGAGLIPLNGFAGSMTLVVDCAAGEEGSYRLRVECLPLTTSLDCSAAPLVGCGVSVAGDLLGGTASQDSYWCSLADYSGREEVWAVEFPTALPSATFTLTATSGDPDLVVVYPCDANACLAAPSDAVTLPDVVGIYYVVVDSAPGAEGAYVLSVTGGTTPSHDVGGALRATAHSEDSVTFAWPLAPAPLPGEEYAVFRADGDPMGPFSVQGATRLRTWTDAAAPPTFPRHVWFYDVRFSDACGNVSLD